MKEAKDVLRCLGARPIRGARIPWEEYIQWLVLEGLSPEGCTYIGAGAAALIKLKAATSEPGASPSPAQLY
ncbi:hypothetical protein GB937_010230 [Aspergillus fischeri]|nr:hypothetical protein GB937_010230 [Aspergillus fischeri]